MKDFPEKLRGSRIGTLILLTALKMVCDVINALTELSGKAIIEAALACVLAAWLLRGLVRVKKQHYAEGTNTIRRYVKFVFIYTCVVIGILCVNLFITSSGLLRNLTAPELREQAALLLVLILLPLVLIFDVVSLASINRTARLAYELADGMSSADADCRQGKLPEVFAMVNFIIDLAGVILVCCLLLGVESFGSVKNAVAILGQLLGLAASAGTAFVAYTLLRDFRKAVNE